MYLEYFGLREIPFRNTPDIDFFYGAADRKEIVEALEYIASRRDALVIVTGEVGSGKTTVLRILAERLRKKNFKIVYIPTPRLTADEILKFIAKDLGVEIEKDASKADIYDKLYNHLVKVYEKYNGIVLLIDEAHTIPLDTLEEVRLLSNIETEKDKLITIILFGQPELEKMLDKSEARQLKSRVSHSFTLRALTSNQVFDYLNFRMKKAGCSGKSFFSREIADEVYKITRGLPRSINIIADKLLLSVYSRGGDKVDAEDIENVLDNKNFKQKKIAGTLLSGVAITFLFLYFIYFVSFHGENSPVMELKIQEEKRSGLFVDYFYADRKETRYNGLPWNSHSLVVKLATIPCSSVSNFKKLLNDNNIDNVFIYEFNKGDEIWCSFVKGEFESLSEAREFISKLPSVFKKSNPYPIEVFKINKEIKKRMAIPHESS